MLSKNLDSDFEREKCRNAHVSQPNEEMSRMFEKVFEFWDHRKSLIALRSPFTVLTISFWMNGFSTLFPLFFFFSFSHFVKNYRKSSQNASFLHNISHFRTFAIDDLILDALQTLRKFVIARNYPLQVSIKKN